MPTSGAPCRRRSTRPAPPVATRRRIRGATETVLSSVREAQRDAGRLAPYAGPDVRGALRLPAGTPRWPGSGDQWAAPEQLTTVLGEQLSLDADSSLEPVPPK